jgi:hypothetical protein
MKNPFPIAVLLVTTFDPVLKLSITIPAIIIPVGGVEKAAALVNRGPIYFPKRRPLGEYLWRNQNCLSTVNRQAKCTV